ncbi:MAG: YlbF family regulator [Nitrospirae bacterium]|nr:YlbF family regulator [Nitrospirota bacterium]
MSTLMLENELKAIEDRINEFAEAITSSPEFLEFEKNYQLIQQDSEAKKLLRDYKSQAPTQSSCCGSGADSSKGKAAENPSVKKYLASEEGIIAACSEINNTISRTIGFDFAQTAAPSSSCGCC